MRFVRNFILTLILVAAASPASAQETVDTAGWLRDFAQLKSEMASHYANLEWAVDGRRMDLRALSEQTAQALRSASSHTAARQALQSFLAAFGDGHLEIRFPTIPPAAQSAGTSAPASVCARQRYIQRAPRIRIPFDRLPQFRRIDNDDARYFPLGILQMPNGQRVGVLRIASFEDNVFIDLCERAATELAIEASRSCPEKCARNLKVATSNLITEALARQIAVAKSNEIAALLVDITHNGGGTNWVEAAARTLTPTPLKAPLMGVVRHRHHVRQFEAEVEALRKDLKAAKPSHREQIETAITTLQRAKREAEQACDRSPLWEGKTISCSGLVTEPKLYATGVLNYAHPDALPGPANCCVLFYPAQYRYEEGVYRGKLMVLVDRETASAAEYFAALLRDNDAAELLGEATYGAGCGYTNGGIPATLKFTGARVVMPDCARFRANGVNEVDGIIPDVLVPWRISDSPFQRADKVYRILADRMQ